MASHSLTPTAVPTFRPAILLRNRHLQSILGSLPPMRLFTQRRAAALLACAQEWVLDCGEGVRLQAFYSADTGTTTSGRGERLAVLLHGWEGSADSSYVLSLGATLFQHGYAVLRLNLRDHGASHHLNREIFHSCRLPEVVGALRALSARLPRARVYLAGLSLGGNFTLRVAADASAPAAIVGAVAISPVLDPAATLRALEQAVPIYRRYFVRRWSRSLRAKQRAWPGVHDFEGMLRLADLRTMTAGLVRQCTEFPNLDAYLAGYAITGSRLASLRVPASLLIAEDDPIIPAQDLQHLAPSSHLQIVRTRYGGHCGFMDGWTQPGYAGRFVLEQFERFARLGERIDRIALERS